MEPFAVPDNRRQEQQVAAPLEFAAQTAGEMVAGLWFHRQITVRTVLSTEPGEEKAEEMIDLGDGGDGALASAAGRALFDADGGGEADDTVDVGPGQLFHELPGIGVHGVQEPS